jgi:hypothetical protein
MRFVNLSGTDDQRGENIVAASGASRAWFHLDQKMSGSSVFAPSAPKPSALYQFKDQDTVLVQFRAQRNS